MPDFSGINKSLTKVQQQFTTFQNKINSSMKIVASALSGLAIGKLIKDSTTSAMTVENSISQISRIMGDNANQFNEWAQTQAKSFGMAKTEAYKYGAVYSNLISGFTQDTAETTKYTQQLIQASAIVASKTGRTMEDTMDRIRSGLLGNTEAIEDLGIYAQVGAIEATDAFKKLANGKSWNQLDYNIQQQIRLMSILEQANTKYGDSLAGTTATKQMMFVATLKNIQLNIGQAFLPIYNVVLPALTSLADKVESITASLATLSQALFGYNKTQIQSTVASTASAKAQTDIGKAVDSTSKKVKGSLSGFDQLNTITQNTADAMADAADSSSGLDAGTTSAGNTSISPDENVDTNALTPIVKKLDNIKTGLKDVGGFFKDAFGKPLKDIVNNTIPILQGWKQAFSDTFNNVMKLGEPLKNWVINDLVPSWVTAVSVLGHIFDGVMDSALQVFIGLKNAIMPILMSIATDGLPFISSFSTQINLLFQSIFDSAKYVFDTLWSGAIAPGLQLASQMISDAITTIRQWWDNWGQQIVDGLRQTFDKITQLFDTLWHGILEPIVTNMLQSLKSLWDDHLLGLIGKIGEFVGILATKAIDFLNTFIMPIINSLVEKLSPTFSSIFNTIVIVVKDALGLLFDTIGSILMKLTESFDVIRGLFEKLWHSFLEPIVNGMLKRLSWLWDKHIKGLVQQLGALVNSVIEFIGVICKQAINLFNNFIAPIIGYLVDKLGPTFANIFNYIADVVGTVVGTISDIISGLLRSLRGIIEFLTGVFSGDWQKAWQGIQDIFGGIFDGIVGILKGAINLIIDGINFMIRGLDQIKFDMPNWDWLPNSVQGKSFGISIPEIPKLATGGLATAPTLAMVGDNPNAAVDPEVISPLSKLQEMLGTNNQPVVDVLMLILNALKNTKTEAVLKIGETELARVAARAINDLQNRSGESLITV